MRRSNPLTCGNSHELSWKHVERYFYLWIVPKAGKTVCGAEGPGVLASENTTQWLFGWHGLVIFLLSFRSSASFPFK
jgi:hypothetical protein